MPANGLNLFLLIASIFEILLLQIGYVRSAKKNRPKKSRAQCERKRLPANAVLRCAARPHPSP